MTTPLPVSTIAVSVEEALLNLVPVEEALKREVGTPSCWNSRNSQQVEEALKRLH